MSSSAPAENNAMSETTASAPVAAPAPPKRWIRTPPIDIYESDDGLVLLADLPGVSANDLEVQVQDNKLTLFGRRQESLDEGTRVVHQEYPSADFLRSFILSEDVDHERISAHINDGVLEIRLPRAAKSAPRRIQVQTDRQ
jgi:HSP20 family molecular chaperone IbpA